jgi:Carboxypeptidase regulatory-like domain
MKTKRTKRRTTTRISLFAGLLALVSLNAEPQKKPPPHAVVAGTVFKDPGFALPDVTVVLMRQGDPKHKKLQELVSNFRGEFAFPVPPAEAKYVVRASLKGFHPAEKEVSISGEERIEVTLVLVPESKK